MLPCAPPVLLAIALALPACDGCSPRSSTRDAADPNPEPASSTRVDPPPPCPVEHHAPERAACLAPVERASGLLVFVHGLYRGDGELDTRRRVIEAAHARGVSVLVVQGERGFCDWDPDMLDAVCWPAAPHQVDALRGMSEGWRDAIAAAGVAGPTVLLGYSNGAFAAARVAVEPTWIPDIETYVIAMGGLQGELDPMTRPRAALLLRAAEDDPHHRRTMEDVSDRLSRAGLGHDFVLREGGHALADSDITAAIDAIVGVNSTGAGRE